MHASVEALVHNGLMHKILCDKLVRVLRIRHSWKVRRFATSALLNYTLNFFNRNGPSLLSRVLPVKLWQVRWHRFCSSWNNVRHRSTVYSTLDTLWTSEKVCFEVAAPRTFVAGEPRVMQRETSCHGLFSSHAGGNSWRWFNPFINFALLDGNSLIH